MARSLPAAVAATVGALAAAAAMLPAQASANGCMPSQYDAATNTYTLSTAAQLHRFGVGGCDLSATVRIAGDIDLTGTGEFTPIGDSGTPFTGTFDGAGHTITGLQITSPGRDAFGLIGNADGAIIRDVSVSGTVLEPGNTGGGLLVGIARRSTITRVTASGTVRARTGAGGVVGIMQGGVLTDVTSGVVVTADATGGTAGGIAGSAFTVGLPHPVITRVRGDGPVSAEAGSAGGVLGSLNAVTLGTASSTASVRARRAGGLVGASDADGGPASITDSFSTGNVMGAPSGTTSVGGIVGETCSARPTSLLRNYFAGTLAPLGAPSGGIVGDAVVCSASLGALATVEGNLWNTDTAGAAGAVSGVGVGRANAQMKEIATYTALGWSMVNGWEPVGTSTWGICSQVNGGYPFLQGQTSSTACQAPAATPSAGVIPPALTATVLPSRRRVVSGQALRIGIRVRNTGGDTATSAVSCVRLPVRLVPVRTSGAVRSGQVACFRVGSVAVGAQATRVITARAVSARRATVRVTGTATAAGLRRASAPTASVTITPRALRARVTG